MNNYIKWVQDNWNNNLWTRVTDVNADRTNQYINRPVETKNHSIYTKCSVEYNECNLPNYQIENQLRAMLVSNNKDTIDYYGNHHCHQKPSDLNRSSININKDTTNFRQVTREIYQTVDNRNNMH